MCIFIVSMYISNVSKYVLYLMIKCFSNINYNLTLILIQVLKIPNQVDDVDEFVHYHVNTLMDVLLVDLYKLILVHRDMHDHDVHDHDDHGVHDDHL